ncbi:MAG TPA: DUF4893 domain-containing protein [Allosphingosinicella sp.]|jgi:hypothetical protein|nr:DUF4893 domain-containing protein [Allosphingosinicella sp.]
MSLRVPFVLIACLASAASAQSPTQAADKGVDESVRPERCVEPDPGSCAARARGERRVRTWRQTATEDDRRRLREWREAFVEGLREARSSGHGDEVAREGALLNPDAAISGAPLPGGDYLCRTLKLGSQSGGALDFIAYPAFRCRVSAGRDGLMHFTKLTGSQRPVGRLYPEHEHRQVFLGTMQLSDERQVLSYGRDTQRNMAGIVERVGARQWRILFPYPHFESTLDVIELVPAS